jgi:hypothetical protein
LAYVKSPGTIFPVHTFGVHAGHVPPPQMAGKDSHPAVYCGGLIFLASRILTARKEKAPAEAGAMVGVREIAPEPFPDLCVAQLPAVPPPCWLAISAAPRHPPTLRGRLLTLTVVQSGRLRRPRAAAFLLISKAPAEAGQIQPLATPKIQ